MSIPAQARGLTLGVQSVALMSSDARGKDPDRTMGPRVGLAKHPAGQRLDGGCQVVGV